jgi:hypothetical protein
MSAPYPQNDRQSVLVGVPNAEERARIASLLRTAGYSVVEAADAQEMGARLDEIGPPGFDAIVCAGILSERDDPVLASRLANASADRALVLLPSGGLLSTATRAQRLGASVVWPRSDSLHRLRELLSPHHRDPAPG